jgi:hypothetical protein
MINISKITAAALVALVSINAGSVSAQSLPTTNTVAQTSTNQADITLTPAQHAINTRCKCGNANLHAHRGFGWDVKTNEPRRVALPQTVATPVPVAPIPTAAPTTPEWPCGTVATSPNPEVIASSTSC